MIQEVVDRALRLKVQPDLVGLLNNQRLYYRKKNDVAGCRKTAELWESLRRSDARSLYNAACYRAVTAAVGLAAQKSSPAAQEARADADRAMAWLKQAIAAGYDNVALMQKDSDLDALRDRGRFPEITGRANNEARDSSRQRAGTRIGILTPAGGLIKKSYSVLLRTTLSGVANNSAEDFKMRHRLGIRDKKSFGSFLSLDSHGTGIC